MNNIRQTGARRIPKPITAFRKSRTDQGGNSDLYAASGELPAVYSHSFRLDFDYPVEGDAMIDALTSWIDTVRQWARRNRYFIGHIKMVAEAADGFSVWLSTTGNQISRGGAEKSSNLRISNCSVVATAILFGVDEVTLKNFILDSLPQLNRV